MTDPNPVEQIGAVVDAWAATTRIGRGPNADNTIWVGTPSVLRRYATDHSMPLPERVDTALLRRAARAGRIVTRYQAGRHQFTSHVRYAESRAEVELTDMQRAERTAAFVRDRYERQRREHGDNVHRWPVTTDYAACPQDGIRAAIELGLLVEVGRSGLSNLMHYVPAECFDAFQTAVTDAEERAERLTARNQTLADQLLALAGPADHGRPIVQLNATQVRQLLQLLEGPSEPTP